jgi:excisionase family DNA binding protein
MESYNLRNKRQAARYLGVSVGLIERLMRSQLSYVRVGNLVRFTPEDLDSFIGRQRVEAPQTPAAQLSVCGEARQ